MNGSAGDRGFGGADPDREGLRVLVFTTLFPRPAQPQRGLFVRDRVVAMARYCRTRVVAPVLSRSLTRRFDSNDGRGAVSGPDGAPAVTYPPYLTIPGAGRWTDGWTLFRQTLAHVSRLRLEFPFDLIDAHYAFPDGAAATMLAEHFRVPVAVTVRGGDLDLLPRYRLRRRVIAKTLRRADRVIAISEHLAERATALGAPSEAVVTIPNGVDREKFFCGDRDAARRSVGFAGDRPLILCVANLLPEKGQHVLIQTLDRMRSGRNSLPDVAFIGGDPSQAGWYRARLARMIARADLGDRVRLLGALDQTELPAWYRAADVLVLPSFREGCPNVVREALACGTPAVAFRVGGVPELLTSEKFGLMVAVGDVEALAQAIETALGRRWEHSSIAEEAGRRDWDAVGAEVARELAGLVRT